jgi:hypothetical protein
LKHIRYTDGFNELTEEEFLNLQDRLCAGDPVALAFVIIQQRKAQLARDSDNND